MAASQSTVASNLSTSFWIGKQSAYKLWQNIAQFVTDYCAEDPAHMAKGDWFNQWYHLYEIIRIGDKTREFQMVALAITQNPDASVHDCLLELIKLIPELKSYLTIEEKNDAGNVRVSMKKYGFQTPSAKNTIKSPTAKEVPPNLPDKKSQNRYQGFIDYDNDNNLEDSTILDTELNLPTTIPNQSFTLEQHTASDISVQTKDITQDLHNQMDTELITSNKVYTQQKLQAQPTSSFKNITNKTRNAFRNLAFKTQDFANDRDFATMLKSGVFNNEKGEKDSGESLHDVNIQNVTNDDVKKDIGLMQMERKNLSNKLRETKNFLRDMNWDAITNGAVQLQHKFNDLVSKLDTHASTIASKFSHDMHVEQQCALRSFKTDCVVESSHIKTKVLAEIKNQMRVEFEKELEDQAKFFESKLTALRQLHESKLKTIAAQHQTTSTPTPPVVPSTTPSNVPSNMAAPVFGPTPTPTTSAIHGSATNPIHIYGDNQRITFQHQGDNFTLQDKEFLKHSITLQAPTTEDDALSLYTTLQKSALLYNIFVTPIDKITKWDLSPNSVPTTCNLEKLGNNSYYQAYQRMATTLFTKLNKVNFSKVPTFRTLIEYEKSTQDGYRVLYNLLSCCHPRLAEQTKLDVPKMDTNGNLFTFVRHYKNWLEYERISNRLYNDLENLMMIISVLENDGRFVKALGVISMQKHMYEQMCKMNPSTPFPTSLTIDTLPHTVMNSYDAEEKRELFGSETIPTINRLSRSTNPYSSTNSSSNRQQQNRQQQNRQSSNTSFPSTLTTSRSRLDEMCPGCGIYGHNIFKNGCDFTASFIKAQRFVDKNPNLISQLLREHAKHQLARRKRLSPRTFADRMQKMAKAKRVGMGPTVKALIDVIGETLDSVMYDDYDDETTVTFIDDNLDITLDEQADEFHDASGEQQTPPSSPEI